MNGERRTTKFQPSLSAYTPEGELRWSYPLSRDSRPVGTINGDAAMGPVDTGKEMGGVLSLTQWHGVYVPFVTTDGLFIDRVYRFNAETQLTADIPTEAALVPRQWGELEVDPLPDK